MICHIFVKSKITKMTKTLTSNFFLYHFRAVKARKVFWISVAHSCLCLEKIEKINQCPLHQILHLKIKK